MSALRKFIEMVARKPKSQPGQVFGPLTNAQAIQYAAIMSQDGR